MAICEVVWEPGEGGGVGGVAAGGGRYCGYWIPGCQGWMQMNHTTFVAARLGMGAHSRASVWVEMGFVFDFAV